MLHLWKKKQVSHYTPTSPYRPPRSLHATATFLCPQGGRCGEVRLYIKQIILKFYRSWKNDFLPWWRLWRCYLQSRVLHSLFLCTRPGTNLHQHWSHHLSLHINGYKEKFQIRCFFSSQIIRLRWFINEEEIWVELPLKVTIFSSHTS